MAKKLVKVIKLQIPAGKANPAPPIGPALGSAGINIMNFCKDFNAKTKDMGGDVVPVEISVFEDKSFTFIMKQSPVSSLIKKTIGIEKGSAVPNRDKVGKLTMKQVQDIAEIKMPDLRVASKEAAYQIVKGCARSMGVDIVHE